MSLEDLDNLGIAIGSLGIVITIGFLALEMRWTRMESKRQQPIPLQQSVMDLELALMSNNAHIALNKWDELAPVKVEGATIAELGNSFTDEELNTIQARMLHAICHLDMIIAKKRHGIISQEEFELIGATMKSLISPLAIRVFALEKFMMKPVREFLQP